MTLTPPGACAEYLTIVATIRISHDVASAMAIQRSARLVDMS
jgi:hypothetical protein